MPDSESLTFIETKNYTIRLEYNEDYVIAHLPTATMTKETFLDMKDRLKSWYRFFRVAGYEGVFAAVDPKDQKIARLLSMLEFKKKGHADNMDVYFYGEV
jgi:hypothetical protein